MSDPVSVASDALVYPFAEFPPPRGVIEVADGIFWLSTPLPFPGLRQINLWLLRDGAGWTMVDCGYGTDEVRAIIAEIWRASLGEARITRLVVTHFHPDHIGNCAWIAERWGVVPMMTQGEWFAANLAILEQHTGSVARRVAFYREHGLDPARCNFFAQGAVSYAAGVRLPLAYRRIGDGDVLEIDGESWTVLVGEGHSPEHAALYCASRRILISGDQILPTITTNVSAWPTEPEGDPLALFLGSCRRFGAILDPASLILPSHRRPFRNVRRRLEELARHHDERLAVVLGATPDETTAAELIDVLFPRALDGHQMGFAMGEAIAHLNHLLALGRMERRRDDAGVYRYRRCADQP